MSSTFDTMQQALAYLDQPGSTGQTSDVIHYMKQIVDALHDHAHAEGFRSRMNFVGGKAVALLNICLCHSDDEDRKMWLKARERA